MSCGNEPKSIRPKALSYNLCRALYQFYNLIIRNDHCINITEILYNITVIFM